MALKEVWVMNLLLPYSHFWPPASPPSGSALSLCPRGSIKIFSPHEYSRNCTEPFLNSTTCRQRSINSCCIRGPSILLTEGLPDLGYIRNPLQTLLLAFEATMASQLPQILLLQTWTGDLPDGRAHIWAVQELHGHPAWLSSPTSTLGYCQPLPDTLTALPVPAIPWHSSCPVHKLPWLSLPNLLRAPNPTNLISDFPLLLCTSQQEQLPSPRHTQEWLTSILTTRNLWGAPHPTPTFIPHRSYLNRLKVAIFCLLFLLVLVKGAAHISPFKLGYLLARLYLLLFCTKLRKNTRACSRRGMASFSTAHCHLREHALVPVLFCWAIQLLFSLVCRIKGDHAPREMLGRGQDCRLRVEAARSSGTAPLPVAAAAALHLPQPLLPRPSLQEFCPLRGCPPQKHQPPPQSAEVPGAAAPSLSSNRHDTAGGGPPETRSQGRAVRRTSPCCSDSGAGCDWTTSQSSTPAWDHYLFESDGEEKKTQPEDPRQ
ncbi:hypothetical protein GH733_000601 [Mirounga leonina]|nr:hypothetical protein GH733_000601 [Mirounga leonina]